MTNTACDNCRSLWFLQDGKARGALLGGSAAEELGDSPPPEVLQGRDCSVLLPSLPQTGTACVPNLSEGLQKESSNSPNSSPPELMAENFLSCRIMRSGRYEICKYLRSTSFVQKQNISEIKLQLLGWNSAVVKSMEKFPFISVEPHEARIYFEKVEWVCAWALRIFVYCTLPV